MSGFRKFAVAACLAASLIGLTAQAKVLVVCDITSQSVYPLGETNSLVNQRMLGAVQRVLDDYGASYKVLSPRVAKTEFCRTGAVTHNFGTAGAYVEQFDAVIHVGFNGNSASIFTGYRPDSLTLTAAAPIVPQLMLLDDDLAILGTGGFTNSSADSTWVETSGYLSPGSGSGNHEGEGCVYDVATGTMRWFDTTFGSHIIKKAGSPTGGMRALLSGGANAVMTSLELNGNMPAFPESLSTANTDTMKVWEKLNLHKSGSARVVFATCSGGIPTDSSSAGEPNGYSAQPINWPILLYSIGHLDSLASGNVLGSNKTLKWGAVIYGVGNTSDRRHAGGLFRADTSIAAASGDSVRALGINVVLAADPESLRVNEGPGIWKRYGSVRWTPYVRLGIDTLALPAAGAASYSRPVDVFGRYRNRAIMGDGSGSGVDTSFHALLRGARDTLARITGGQISGTLVPPDDDWSPYQLRAHQNAILADSVQLVAASLGFNTILTNSQNRDREPIYLRTNPKGWIYGQVRVNSTGARFMAHSATAARGSRYANNTDGLSFLGAMTDSVPPVCDPGGCPGPNFAVAFENRFWNGFFGPSRDYGFDAYDLAAPAGSPYNNNWDTTYGQNKASVAYLPAQAFGGQSSSAPNRWGYFVLKHLTHATRAINAGAWRPIIQNAFPEDIDP